ncbi:cobalt-zinc-cadmium efflux system outer membrane protein [Haloferula luteola]|uniref:Cobalt-zinc-cadmium efflux system outer membrane protein n=1 Tax=Haloferula luteola TaxID=595692 RepID=A0A840UXG7_9BACT|nr:TolC family protein [Haloferula luteola]MBB5350857.1 cobalt-zinc-cadmium efflux system outer membrane protein [Haloferula luteola]
MKDVFDFVKLRTILWISLVLPAWSNPGVVVTLDSVAQRVRADNPQLAAASCAIDEALGHARQAGRLENPELEVEMEHNDRFSERRLELGLSQRFPVTHRLRLERDLGATEVQAAQREVAEATNALIGEARTAVVEVLALRGRQDLVRKQEELAQELADFTAEIAEKGEGSVLDAGQARLATARFSTEIRRLAAEEQRAVGTLKPLLGLAPGEALTVSGALPALQLPEGADPTGRPALEVARLAVLEAEQQAAIERTKRYGDVQAGFFVAGERVVDAPEAAEKEAMVGIRFSIPLPFWDRNEGNIEAAEARAERRRREVTALDQSIRLEAEAARNEMLEWAKLAGEVGDALLPQAAEQTELAEQAWREGQGDLLTVLRSREQRLELAAARLDALKNFHLARVRYRTALGDF